jgi:hypothetical protein
MNPSEIKATTFKVELQNKEIVKVVFKPYNGLLVLFEFYGCISPTGYQSQFIYIMDKVWNNYNDVQVLAKDLAQHLYKIGGYKYLAQIQQKQQLRLF